MMQELNWQCKSRHFRNVCPNSKFVKFINKPSTQEKPLISTARIQTCMSVQFCAHTLVLTKLRLYWPDDTREPREPCKQNSHRMNYQLPRNADGQLKELERVITVTLRVQATNLEAVQHKQVMMPWLKMFKTLVNFHICLNEAVLLRCFRFIPLDHQTHTPKSKSMQKGKNHHIFGVLHF